MNSKKILLTTGIFPPEIGGPATYSALLQKELPGFGIEVEVLPFRTVRHLPSLIRHLVFFWKVFVRGRKADLLYTQDPVSVGFPTMLAAKILRKPFLARIAGDWVWEQSAQRFGVKESIDDFQLTKYGFKVEFLRKIEHLTVKFADLVITPSQYFRKLVSKWNPSKNNVITIYNGISFSDIINKEASFESKTMISAGRLVPWKGFDCLIEMMPNLPDWKLFIAGEGPDHEKLNKLILDLNLADRVFLLGNMERGELIQKIQKSEIFILNTSFESFSFQVVEAMRAKTPVVTTNIGNLSEIIKNGQEGILVEPNNTNEIIEAIEKLSHPEFRKSLVEQAFIKSEMFSIQNTLEQTSKTILQLITNKKT